ncbi:MAG: hypothetical protein Q7R60_01885 [bacterium]|nr:hypothetical protein [bacterium]
MAYKSKSKADLTPVEVARKKDALALAKLILDIYKENKMATKSK